MLFRRLTTRELSARSPASWQLTFHDAVEACVPRLRSTRKLTGHEGCVNAAQFHHAGELLATGSDDQRVKLWHVAQNRCVTTLEGHRSNVFAVKLVPDRK